MRKILQPKYLLLPALLPLTAFAQVSDVFDFQVFLFDVLTKLSYLAWAALFAFFVFGIVKFIYNADDTAEREKGKQYIIWAIICLVVIVSIWGIVNFILVDTLGLVIGGTPGFITDP